MAEKWISPWITGTFNKHHMWGTHVPYSSGVNSDPIENDTAWKYSSGSGKHKVYVPNDTPYAPCYSGAVFCIYDADIRAYTLTHENPSDKDVHIRVVITCKRFDMYGFGSSGNTETVNDEGFIDIGGIHWSPYYTDPSRYPQVYNNEYFDNVSASWDQYIEAINGTVTGYTGTIGAMSSDINESSLSNQLAKYGISTVNQNGTFEYTLPWGTDGPGSSDSAFEEDGSIKAAYQDLPVYWAFRQWWPNDRKAVIYLEKTLSINLSLDLDYVPWGIKKDTGWVSCNRNPYSVNNASGNSGLFIRGVSDWGYSVFNNVIKSTSHGFRYLVDDWEISPITPPEA